MPSPEKQYWFVPADVADYESIQESNTVVPDWWNPPTPDGGPIDTGLTNQPPPWWAPTDPEAVGTDKESPLPNYVKPSDVYHSYAGVDIVATINIPGQEGAMDLGELQTISYSIHRENTPVRTLGRVSPRGFLKGPRTIAGSLIFTQFNVYAFYKLRTFRQHIAQGTMPLSDMLPPFDVTISFSNEVGSFSKMRLYGLTIVDEGSTMSIDDLVTEQTFTYMARGIQPMISYLPEELSSISQEIDSRQRLEERFLNINL